MFERILIPLDGSGRAELILAQASRLVRSREAEVLLVRVVEVPSVFEDLNADPYLPGARAEAEEYVGGLEQRLRDQGVRARGFVVKGPAAPSIRDLARREGATMVAMTTHGRTGLARWAMGSVAEKVVRSSDVPVLVVRSFRAGPRGVVEPPPGEELAFERLLVAVDGSPTSLAAVDAASEVARRFASYVLLLHVIPQYVAPGAALVGAGPAAIFPGPPPEDDPVTDDASRRFRLSGVEVDHLSVVGDAASEILDRSRSNAADLIVLGTHGRSGPSRFVLGSVAERVLRHARVPVLLARSPSVGRDSGKLAGVKPRE